MLGLIKKDLLMMKGKLKSLLIILIIFGLMAIEQNNDLSFFPVLISIMLSISTFSYDEYNKWNSYVITLPNGRKNVIRAKYLSALILSIVAIILSIILLVTMESMTHHINLMEITSKMVICFFSIGLIISVTYPILFKFGVEKGRIAIFIGIFILVTLMGLIVKKVKLSLPTYIIHTFTNYNLVILPMILIIILSISYKISILILSKKEY